jgi:PBP1b-binding outer membrane lipoprotein LpoB
MKTLASLVPFALFLSACSSSTEIGPARYGTTVKVCTTAFVS